MSENTRAAAKAAATTSSTTSTGATAETAEKRLTSYTVFKIVRDEDQPLEKATVTIFATGVEASSDKAAIKATAPTGTLDEWAAVPRFVPRRPQVETKTVTRW